MEIGYKIMEQFFLHLEKFTFFSYLALVIVVLSFFMGKRSKSPYMPLLFSNLGFFIYRFTSESYLGIDFAMYFILISIFCATWFLIIKNIEEEENEDRILLRGGRYIIIEGENQSSNRLENEDSKSFSIAFLNTIFEGVMNFTSGKAQNQISAYFDGFSGNDQVQYYHPQRTYINICMYLILIAILGSFFFI